METINKREAWNKGKLVGQKPPLKPKDIWAIRIYRAGPIFFGQNFHCDKWSPAGVALSTVAAPSIWSQFSRRSVKPRDLAAFQTKSA